MQVNIDRNTDRDRQTDGVSNLKFSIYFCQFGEASGGECWLVISNVFNRAVFRQIEWDDDGRLMICKIGNNDIQ